MPNKICKLLIVFCCALGVTHAVLAQGVPPPAIAKQVEIDLINESIKGKIPFDAPFEFIGTPPKTVDVLKIRKVQLDSSTGTVLAVEEATWARQYDKSNGGAEGEDAKAEKFRLFLLFKQGQGYPTPNHRYLFYIDGYACTWQGQSKVASYSLVGTTESGLSDHIKLDFGLGYAFKPRAVVGLTTVHFYFSPINEDTDLNDEHLSFSRHFLLRTSLFAGLSPVVFSEHTEQEIKRKFALGSFVYGVGLRSPFYSPWFRTGRFGRVFFQPMRVNVGVLNFKQANQNVSIAGDVNKRALFMSITYDFNIASILGPLGKLVQ
ncbi:hypothetical protein [Hymenobacter negativus]|uniref:Uncharacterized protein n=1 Tax=Hymenobacter negativus TaxID=2795026 RepID=A0ABS0Q5A1_9BACT|nr:hypothetical protein [Hymenobacter negativus]MBH8557747.1 hypothetical protein [Hymenobacter negativus]